MKRVVIGLMCISSSVAAFAGYDDGMTAYQKQDYVTALKEWKPLAEQGNLDAQYNLGILYENGQGVAKDYKQAFFWYKKVANQGYPNAQNKIGVMYAEGKGVERDYPQAAHWLRNAADQDVPAAQSTLALLLESGVGVAEDDKQAADYFYKAGLHDNKFAQVQLGKMYCGGQFLHPAYSVSGNWLNKVAQEGNVDAQLFLGEHSLEFRDQVAWLRKAAAQGDGRAMVLLGAAYDNPQDGQILQQNNREATRLWNMALQKLTPLAENDDSDAMYYLGVYYARVGNRQKAVEWYLKAAKLGHKAAKKEYARAFDDADPEAAMSWWAERNQQGWMRDQAKNAQRYHRGWNGLKQDQTEAAKWFRVAAEQGDDESQEYMGYYYNNGLGGLHRDYQEARKWYLKAANQGGPDANAILGLLIYTGRTVNNLRETAIRDENKGLMSEFAEAAKTIKKTNSKDPEAQFLMGIMYSQGWGVKANGKEAIKWLTLAANQGHPGAQTVLAVDYLWGNNGLEKNPAEAMRLNLAAANHGSAIASQRIAYMYEDGKGVEKNSGKAAEWYRKAAEQGSGTAMEKLMTYTCGTSAIF